VKKHSAPSVHKIEKKLRTNMEKRKDVVEWGKNRFVHSSICHPAAIVEGSAMRVRQLTLTMFSVCIIQKIRLLLITLSINLL
jgi:metal-responsive CopG/Arc/MetJ family transcriptional regulator